MSDNVVEQLGNLKVENNKQVIKIGFFFSNNFSIEKSFSIQNQFKQMMQFALENDKEFLKLRL